MITWTVSVPYRGATFLNEGRPNPDNQKYQFPSPIGELHFSMASQCSHWQDRTGFRHLSGSYISQYKEVYFPCHANPRFRPLSGSYISQWIGGDYMNLKGCFRPLSGSYISQYRLIMRRLDVLRFPSPIGELHFSIFFCFSFPLPVSYCFRPLSGSYISQWGFQILQKEEQTCFRPLSGSYISQ